MSIKDIKKISERLITTKGVQALSDKPSMPQQYGQAGLSAADLKKWFDYVPTKLIEKLNELIGALQSEALSSDITVDLAGEKISLSKLTEEIGTGELADKLTVMLGERQRVLSEWITDFENEMHQYFTDVYATLESDYAKLSDISKLYDPKGSVNSYAELPKSAQVGDCYNVESEFAIDGKTYPAGTNVVWTSEGWDTLGGFIDLSAYSTTEKIDEKLKSKIGIIDNTGYAMDQIPAIAARSNHKVVYHKLSSTSIKGNSIPYRAEDGRLRAAYDENASTDEYQLVNHIGLLRQLSKITQATIGGDAITIGASATIDLDSFGLFIIKGSDVKVSYNSTAGAKTATGGIHILIKYPQNPNSTNAMLHFWASNGVLIPSLDSYTNTLTSDVTIYNGSNQYSCRVVRIGMKGILGG